MASVEQPCYTLINFPTDSEPHNEMQLKHDLEKGDTKKKIEALKKVISIILAGEKIPGILMIIIRFILPLQDHTVKKLLLIFWEIVPKTAPDGRLLQEMILVCDAYRKDLQHPNEFIRGSTLRFLCKLKEPELLEPLMPAIRACLDHRHSYVRRNAVLAIFTIYRNFEFLIPDAPELVSAFLEGEQDMSCKRNAFLMLLHADQERALAYLAARLDHVSGFGDILQLVIVELIYKVCHAAPGERSRFIRTVYQLLNAASAAVRYEAAGTLVTLSTAPAAIKAAAACYIDLIVKESDNNVKLIVVGRLDALREECGEAAARALPDLAMDVLRVLASSDLDVRRRTLQLALELVGGAQAEQLVGVLRKEAARAGAGAGGAEHDDAAQYRVLLVRAMHAAALKFPEAGVAGSVAPALLELLGDGGDACAPDVLVFLRSALHAFPALQADIYQGLVEAVGQVKAGAGARAALWLLAEFADSPARAELALHTLQRHLPPAAPAAPAAAERADTDTEAETTDAAAAQAECALERAAAPAPARRLVTSDGTYASQSAFSQPAPKAGGGAGGSASGGGLGGLSAALCAGEGFTVACACSALAKLALRLPPARANEALHAAARLLAHHKQRPGSNKQSALTADDVEHAALCLRAAAARPPVVTRALLRAPRLALAGLLALPDRRPHLLDADREREPKRTERKVEVETGISFACLAGGAAGAHADMFELSLSRALQGRAGGAGAGAGAGEAVRGGASRGALGTLGKVTQLTGFSDPVYAEAIISVNQYDIVLDVLVVNQTGMPLNNDLVLGVLDDGNCSELDFNDDDEEFIPPQPENDEEGEVELSSPPRPSVAAGQSKNNKDDTLQNCTVELATLGDLRLVERPAGVVLAPRDHAAIRAHVKVASTENGIIFGNIVYEVSGASLDRGVVVLRDIHIDIVDYIQPAACSDAAFRTMWAEFEWENKVSVNTNITDLREYLQHLLASTNMKCLTPDQALSGQCGFMAANLYARSIFGEDALANLSIELQRPGAPVTGHVRIRAKSQGMALSLGDKINTMHKAAAHPAQPATAAA